MKNPIIHIDISGSAYFAFKKPDNSIVFSLSRFAYINDAGNIETFQHCRLEPPLDFAAPFNNVILISSTGEASQLILGSWRPCGQIVVAMFADPAALQADLDDYYSPTLASGDPQYGIAGTAGQFENVHIEYQQMFPNHFRHARAVMKVTYSDFNGVLLRANRVIAILFDNGFFPQPKPPVSVITTERNKLQSLINEVSTGNLSKTGLRDGSSLALYNLLQQELGYVNEVADGDIGLLNVSGFAIAKLPSPHGIPEQPQIKAIKQGRVQKSAQIAIKSLNMKNLWYHVEINSNPYDENGWKSAIDTRNSRKLLLNDLPHGVWIFVRIRASNARGTSLWSNIIAYMSNI